MTTAASVGCGRSRSSPGAKSRSRRMAAAPTRPVTWVLAPFCAATAVRDPLVLTGNPWKKPAAMFAAPTPIISRSPSTSAPVRAANADAVEIVSVNDTSAIPSAPSDQQPQVVERNGGNRERRNALRHRPDHRHAAVLQVEQVHGRDREHHGNQHARNPRERPLEAQDQDQARQRRPPGLPPPCLRRQGLAQTRPPRRSGCRRRPRSRRAWAAGRPRWSAPGRSCTRSASAWTTARPRTRA